VGGDGSQKGGGDSFECPKRNVHIKYSTCHSRGNSKQQVSGDSGEKTMKSIVFQPLKTILERYKKSLE